jgi:hypothetical protein
MLLVILGSCLVASARTFVPRWPLERAMTSSMACVVELEVHGLCEGVFELV